MPPKSRREMKLLEKECDRKMTFRKRKKNIYKKAEELATLCDIDVCMIAYEADQKKGRPVQPETWPEDPSEFNRILNKYKASKDISAPGLKRNFDMSDFCDVVAKNANVVDANVAIANAVGANVANANAVDANVVDANAVDVNVVDANAVDANVVDANAVDVNVVDANAVVANVVNAKLLKSQKQIISEENCPPWDDRLNEFSQEQLIKLLSKLDAKIQATTKKIAARERNNGFVAKQNQNMSKGESSKSKESLSMYSKHTHHAPAHPTSRELATSSSENDSSINTTAPAMQLMPSTVRYPMLPSAWISSSEKEEDLMTTSSGSNP